MRTPTLVYRSALIAALGGLLFGFDTAAISGAIADLKGVFLLDDWWLGFTVASALIGTIVGAATIQYPSNHWGRKPTLIFIAILYLLSAIASACPWNMVAGTMTAWDWYGFLLARFVGGIAIGSASVVSPLYTAEISPAKSRGVLVAITQFNLVFGILVAFFSNYIIAGLADNEAIKWMTSDLGWRWMFGIQAFPSALFFVLLFIVPESPRWLIGKGRSDKAKPILDALGTDSGNVDEEIAIIEKAIAEERQGGKKEVFFCYRYRFPIFLAICMAAFNQLSGINAVLYYAPTVFTIAGASAALSMFLPVVIGFTNLVFTMVAMYVIDWFGRRKLMLAGSIGYITSLCIVAGAFHVYSPEFNISIANVAKAKAEETIESTTKALETATSEDVPFLEGKREAAKQELQEATAELQEAKVAFAKIRGHETDGTVPMAGIMIVLGGLMLFIASHAFGQGACIWVFLGEIFPNQVRAQGQALGSFVHWIFCALIAQLFLPMLNLVGPAMIFFGFAGFMVMQLLWVIGIMPETKQIPLEEMQKKLGIK
jgi:sugar porter (SP) family MFS transporter